MNKHTQKLRSLIEKHLHQPKNQILRIFGRPSEKSDSEVWFYRKFRFSPFNEEITFVFENERVVDISLNQYFLWMEVLSVYYFEGQSPEYKIVSLTGLKKNKSKI
ncbi:hypothetical protein [Chryseobacterium sp. Mn2064]|uniref:hypothetical protein n=1 Tax=Chryseobacterium sp. Mn2064 TaxID=3395263 RepID=UPI003BD28A72